MSKHKPNEDETVNLGMPAPSGAEAGARCPCLRLLTGSFAGRLYRLIRPDMSLGRAPDNDIVLEAPGVSRVHCRLTRTPDGGVLLTDMGSTNGTFVGGESINTKVLQEGDQVGLATQVILRFSHLDLLQEQAEEPFYQRASMDELTGALNRRAYLERLAIQFDAAQARDLPLSVARIDADHFKRVGDTWGQSAADAVLIELARRFRQALGAGEWLGRLGGEEFSLLLGCGAEPARERVERLRRELAGSRIRVPGSQELEVTVSIGLATLLPEHGDAWGSLLKSADLALYQAKEGGRNRVVVFQSQAGDNSKPADKPAKTGPKPIPAPVPKQGPTAPKQTPAAAGPTSASLSPPTRLTRPPKLEGQPPEDKLVPPPPPQRVLPRLKLPQRRRLVRLACQFQVSCMGPDRVPFSGMVKDMSVQGLRVESPKALDPGTLVAMLPGKTNVAVTVKVVWCRPAPGSKTFVIGAAFQVNPAVLEGSWVKKALQSLGFGRIPSEDRRGHARVGIPLPATAYLEHGQTMPGRTLNLGTHGCLLESRGALEVGQKLKLTIGPLSDGQSVTGPAWVLHVRQDQSQIWHCGLMFETWETTQSAVLEHLLYALMGLSDGKK